jgi:hypothetical protein
VTHHRGVVHDLVERQQAEVDGHHLHNGTHSTDRSADARADKRRLAQRRVANPIFSELLEQTFANGVGTSVTAYIFTHEKHAWVFPKERLERGSNGVSIRGHDKFLA